MANNFLVLNNEPSSRSGFERRRGMNRDVDDDDEVKIIRDFQKQRLRNSRIAFSQKRRVRHENRTVALPVLDFIKVNFFAVFKEDLKRLFLSRYGLTPVEYTGFNKTVTFQIESNQLFENFMAHVNTVVNSEEGTSYHQQDYNLIALVHSFDFLSSDDRTFRLDSDTILVSFFESHLIEVFENQKQILLERLAERNIGVTRTSYSNSLIEVHGVSADQILFIANNFDIVKAITSSRTEHIRPGMLGPVREYGFTVEIPDYLTTVGIIDTGISNIEPLRNLIVPENFNHTPHPPGWDEEGHGTLVSGLVAFGDTFYNGNRTQIAKAKLLNLKAIHFSNDDLNIPRIISDIRDARRRHNIKIFNMSLVIPGAKAYNSAYSDFSYELDRLAHEEDLLIFMAVGNFPSDSLEELLTNYPAPEHDYPAFFYDLESESLEHRCEDTNICVPSESLNNISVGALAGNFDAIDRSDVTPLNMLPAYYTRKHHFDYEQKINGTEIKQKNLHLNKPDFVMEGGDLFGSAAGMQILRSPMHQGEPFYGSTCGTSLSAPLICSYAAEILNSYPNLKAQTVKAILINSASYHKADKFLQFAGKESLFKKLTGFGKPERAKLFSTPDNSIHYVMEKQISVNEIMAIPIRIPRRLRGNGNKLMFEVALSYSFEPQKDNHLAYLPLYIAFNLVRNVEIATIAGQADNYKIKGSFSWSEDHFGIDNKLFCNAQKRTFTLQQEDIENVDDSVSLAVRCLAKNGFVETLREVSHPISISLRITEVPKNKNSVTGNLFAEMDALNASLPIYIDDLDADADLEAEA